MIEIFVLILKIIGLLYFTGFGSTLLIIPKHMKNSFIWIVPWMGTIMIALVGITLNLAKIPMQYASFFILSLSTILIIIYFFQNKIKLSVTKEHLFIVFLFIIGLVFNLFVLINKVGFPSTISLLNTDPITYSYTADFLIDHTIYEANIDEPFNNYTVAVGTLLNAGYRWGSPMILSFFDSVLKVKSYEIFTILITIYFVMTFPLVNILAQLLINKKNYTLTLVIFLTYCLNSTLLYILYNAFFGQIIFNGLLVLVSIILFSYIINKKEDGFLLSRTKLILALSVVSIATIYPDGFLLTISPFIVWAIFQLFIKRSYSAIIFVAQIGLLMLIIYPIPILLAFKQNFALFLSSFNNTPPSWEQIRNITPIDMTGFYNLYYYKKLPLIINLIVNLFIVIIWFIGFTKTKAKYFSIACLITFAIFYITFILKDNFFVRLRLATYTLFIFSVLFGIGFITILTLIRSNIIKATIILIIVFLTWRSADRTLRKSYWHTDIVDKSIVSLRSLNNNQKINEPFFMSEVFLGEGNFWRKVWQEYMLNDKKIINLVNYKSVKAFYPNKNIVLSEKKDKRVVYKNIMWQNEYYILGEIK